MTAVAQQAPDYVSAWFYTGRLTTTATVHELPNDHGRARPCVRFAMQVATRGRIQLEVPFPEGAEAAARAFAQSLHVGDTFTARVPITDVYLALKNVPARNFCDCAAQGAAQAITPAPAETDLF